MTQATKSDEHQARVPLQSKRPSLGWRSEGALDAEFATIQLSPRPRYGAVLETGCAGKARFSDYVTTSTRM
eukprot:208373-Prorocentrum_minimum.AAC.2